MVHNVMYNIHICGEKELNQKYVLVCTGFCERKTEVLLHSHQKGHWGCLVCFFRGLHLLLFLHNNI